MSRAARRWHARRWWPGAVLLAGAGAVAMVVAGSARDEGPAPTWDQRVQVASGEAHRGPWRMNQSDFRFVDDATVAVDAHGDAVVVWADQARQDIFLQRYGADGEARFEASVNVSRRGSTFSWLPRVLLAPDGGRQVYVLWQEIIFSGGSHGGEILFARSVDGGRTFDGPVNLSNTEAGAGKGRLDADRWHNGSLDLAMDVDGTLYAAWTEYEGRLWFRRSGDGGRRFSPPIRVAGDGEDLPARGPSLAVGPTEGTVHLAWTVGDRRDADIRFATSDDGGRTFGSTRVVAPGPGHADAPKIAVDAEGRVHLVYAESSEGPERRHHLRYTRMRPGGTFETPRRVGGLPDDRVSSEHFPHVAVDDAGTLFVLFEAFLLGRARPQGLGLTYSTDGGRTFAPAVAVPGISGPILGINGSQQGLLMRKLAVDGAGRLAVVNSTFRRGAASHVWLLRGRLEGAAEDTP